MKPIKANIGPCSILIWKRGSGGLDGKRSAEVEIELDLHKLNDLYGQRALKSARRVSRQLNGALILRVVKGTEKFEPEGGGA